jgi:hypothetical protein
VLFPPPSSKLNLYCPANVLALPPKFILDVSKEIPLEPIKFLKKSGI